MNLCNRLQNIPLLLLQIDNRECWSFKLLCEAPKAIWKQTQSSTTEVQNSPTLVVHILMLWSITVTRSFAEPIRLQVYLSSQKELPAWINSDAKRGSRFLWKMSTTARQIPLSAPRKHEESTGSFCLLLLLLPLTVLLQGTASFLHQSHSSTSLPLLSLSWILEAQIFLPVNPPLHPPDPLSSKSVEHSTVHMGLMTQLLILSYGLTRCP